MTERRQLGLFLLAALCVRWFHIQCLPTLLLGMNPAVACSAKLLLQGTGNDNNFSFPPLPALLMCAPSAILDVPPGFLINHFVLIYSLLYAWAFWMWLDSLRITGLVKLTSCLMFLFIPLNNGYEGLDSSQTLLAGLLFLFIAVLINKQFQCGTCWRAFAMMLLSILLPMSRTEYCLLLPLYIFLCLGIRWMQRRRIPSTNVGAFRKKSNGSAWQFSLVRVVGPVVAGLCIGVSSAGAFRFWMTGELGIVPPEYTCWTFLDGVPSSWLAASDESEFARRKVGIQRFGHPSDYGYSLVAMLVAHPRQSIEKFVLNIPRWFFELGGRAQVLPRPAAVFVLIGLLGLLWSPSTYRHRRLVAQTLAMILMTVPMIAIMLYAEYLRPAFISLCLFMAYGISLVGSTICRVVRTVDGRVLQVSLACLVCAGMEAYYFYSGANHPDAPVLAPIAKLLDEKLFQNSSGRIVIDPYSSIIDSTCRAALGNHAVEENYFKRFERSRTEPASELDVFVMYQQSAEPVGSDSVNAILVWQPASEQEVFQQRIGSWGSQGFDLQHMQEFAAPNQQNWLIAILVKQ